MQRIYLITIFFASFLSLSQMMESELKKMEETVQSIHDEMFYLRSRYVRRPKGLLGTAWLSVSQMLSTV